MALDNYYIMAMTGYKGFEKSTLSSNHVIRVLY